MTTLQIALIGFGCISLYLAMAWLDSKKQWKLIDWFNGETSNPFISDKVAQAQATISDKDAEIAELKERIQILEKIVTEPAYELNKKINSL
ncbi:hypothetical protein [Aliiglaciecola litoralis]|uniref:Phage shock protein B n=1 Tax=Aliiglaciecola litoralis TaxID=582857 RepID=A0ABN1LF55_9ALTE